MNKDFFGAKMHMTYDPEFETVSVFEHDTLIDIKREYHLNVAALREKLMEEGLAKLGYKLVKINE